MPEGPTNCRVESDGALAPLEETGAAAPREQDRSARRAEIAARKARIKETLRCPYCGEPLEKWETPESPFIEWPNDFFYVCFNNQCPYFVEGWDCIAALGGVGSFRLMYDSEKDVCYATPVLCSTKARG